LNAEIPTVPPSPPVAPASPPARAVRRVFTRNLASRVATALVALPLVIYGVAVAPPFVAVALVAAAVLLGILEFYHLLEARKLQPLRRTGFVLTAAMFLEVAYPGWHGSPFWPLAALLLLAVTLRTRGDLADSVSSAAGTLLGVVYLGCLGGCIAALRIMDPLREGSWRVVLLLAIIMFSDTCAYFVGLVFGRHRLAPSLSPGKTVEGAAGGIGGGILGALAVRELGLPDLPLAHTVALGAAVAVMGIVGDLDESLLKRWAGVKDSGTLFPGHGGMLDRLDSLLFGAPVLYYYFLYVR
jgi:phosphatidate cytidylyltransferase